MDNQKVVSTAEKVKAFAIALVGVCFFSIGTTYFEERLAYRLPRILMPVLELFGHIGLAIGMLILGAALIYYGFSKWKKFSQKTGAYWVPVIIALIVGVTLAIGSDFFSDKSKKDATEIQEEMEQNRQKLIDEIKNSGELNFRNANVEKHIAKFDAMYKKYRQAVADGNADGIKAAQDEFMEWNQGTASIMPELNNDQKYELSKYLAKLSIMWSEVEQ